MDSLEPPDHSCSIFPWPIFPKTLGSVAEVRSMAGSARNGQQWRGDLTCHHRDSATWPSEKAGSKGAEHGWNVEHLSWTYPYAPCIEYIPTFGTFIGEMLVNIPYMEHMGYDIFYLGLPQISAGPRAMGNLHAWRFDANNTNGKNSWG